MDSGSLRTLLAVSFSPNWMRIAKIPKGAPSRRVFSKRSKGVNAGEKMHRRAGVKMHHGQRRRIVAGAWHSTGQGQPKLSFPVRSMNQLSCRVLRVALALLALFEAIAVAVHFEDMDVVGQPVEQRAGQPLGPEHAGPLVEGQIAGDEGGAALITLAEDLEQELRAGRRQGDIAEFVDDQQLVTRQLAL